MKPKGILLVDKDGEPVTRAPKHHLKTEEEEQFAQATSAKGEHVTGYLLALQPLLKLHSKLLGGIGPRSHDVGPRVHSLERKTALLVHLTYHRVKR